MSIYVNQTLRSHPVYKAVHLSEAPCLQRAFFITHCAFILPYREVCVSCILCPPDGIVICVCVWVSHVYLLEIEVCCHKSCMSRPNHFSLRIRLDAHPPKMGHP